MKPNQNIPINMTLQAKKEDFNALFEENMGKFPTYKQAYEATEKEHVRLTGNRRYTDYESFRCSRRRTIHHKR